MSLHQITRRTGRIVRVPPAATPILELHLEPHERLVSVEMKKDYSYGDRKTDDWSWVAYVDHDTGPVLSRDERRTQSPTERTP